MYPYNTAVGFKSDININSNEANTPTPLPMGEDKKLIQLLETAIESSAEAKVRFERMRHDSKDRVIATQLRTIYLDMVKAEKLLREVYYLSTGRAYEKMQPISVKPMGTLPQQVEQSMLETLEYADMYKELYTAFMNVEVRDMLMDIITDCYDHCMRLQYVLKKM